MSEEIDTSKELTPKRAFKLNEQDGFTQDEIGDAYDVHRNTVSNRKKSWEETKNTTESVVENKIEEYGLDGNIDDEEPEDNPYDVTECPACGNDMDNPDSAGEKDCPHCGTTLAFTEDEL